MLNITPEQSSHVPMAERRRDEIAVIVPVYMGKAILRELCARLVVALTSITECFSIILVDDRGSDDAWPVIQQLGREDKRIRGIQLSRNFGQHYALTAGIDYSRANWYVVMDCDLEDAPEEIPLLYRKAKEGFDIVVAVRRKDTHGAVKRLTSRLFYAVFNFLAGADLNSSMGNYRIFSESVADGFRQMREQLRFFPASLSLMGFETVAITVEDRVRPQRKSSYGSRKLVSLAGNTILAHSQMPLKIAAMLGFIIATLSLLAGVAIFMRALIWRSVVPGWASLIVVVFIVGGVQIFITGIVGIYVGKSFEESKRRPLYFIRDMSNL
jgi:polyisoprenyl-phosphate glycosyltransferase